MQQQKTIALAGKMSLIAAGAAPVLPYLIGEVTVSDLAGEVPLDDLLLDLSPQWLVYLVFVTRSALFWILLVEVVLLAMAGKLVLRRPNRLTLLADGLVSTGLLCISGYLYRNWGDICSELSVYLHIKKLLLAHGFWISAACTGIALICSLRGLFSLRKAASAEADKGE